MDKRRRGGNGKKLYILFDWIKKENQIPKQWQLTTVKSIRRGGVKEKIQENQRGIFLVNTASKIYESALKKTKMRTCHRYRLQEENKDQH